MGTPNYLAFHATFDTILIAVDERQENTPHFHFKGCYFHFEGCHFHFEEPDSHLLISYFLQESLML